jgi:phosphatidylglycerol:prolipoprotein diacylglycerol transferase
MGFAALVLWHLRDRYRPGVLFAIYLVIAGVERLLIEFIRRNDEVALGLTQAQLVSVVMAAAGIAWLLRARSRGGLAAPSAEATAR